MDAGWLTGGMRSSSAALLSDRLSSVRQGACLDDGLLLQSDQHQHHGDFATHHVILPRALSTATRQLKGGMLASSADLLSDRLASF